MSEEQNESQRRDDEAREVAIPRMDIKPMSEERWEYIQANAGEMGWMVQDLVWEVRRLRWAVEDLGEVADMLADSM